MLRAIPSTLRGASRLPRPARRFTSTLHTSDHRGSPSLTLEFQEKLRHYGDGAVELRQSDRDDRVLELVLNNHKRKNALTGKMMMELHDIALKLISDKEFDRFCGMIVFGAGSTFSSGADFGLAKSIQTPEEGRLMSELMTSTLTRLRRAPLITVAAVDGYAMGGGAELTTVADFRVMAPHARLQFVQARMGVSTGWGGATRLVKLVGRQKALDLLAGAHALDAEAALEVGLVDRVSRNDPVLGAWELLGPYLKHTTEALRAIKMAVAGADDLTYSKAWEVESDVFEGVWASPANLHALKTASEKADKR